MDRLNWYVSRLIDALPWLTMLAWGSVVVLVITSGYLVTLRQRVPVEPVISTVEPSDTTVSQPQITLSPELQILHDLPELPEVTKAIATLYGFAAQHQLKLQEVVYQDQQLKDEPLLRYSVDFTVTQTYPRIKAFVLDMLASMPYLALEQIQMERDDIQAAQIEARLRFRLFMERDNE